jgi:glutathione S-transferase
VRVVCPGGMRTLYHFPMSPFSRRTRLALALKGLDVRLIDAHDDGARLETKRLWATRTVPVLVEPDGRAIGDSIGIVHYLDEAYPDGPRIWPTGSARLDAIATASLVDYALNTIIDLGTRYYDLHRDAAWKKVQDELLGRAQSALDVLAQRARDRGPQPLTDAGWSGADMWLFTMVQWLEGLPERAPTRPNLAQVVSLPWSIPSGLSRWADAFREREDVLALAR